MVIYPLFGALAQLVAHNTGSVGVRSSNLLCSTDKNHRCGGFFLWKIGKWGVNIKPKDGLSTEFFRPVALSYYLR